MKRLWIQRFVKEPPKNSTKPKCTLSIGKRFFFVFPGIGERAGVKRYREYESQNLVLLVIKPPVGLFLGFSAMF